MTPNRTRASDKWGVPSTVAGLGLIVFAILAMVFDWAHESVALAVGILGGVMVQHGSVLGLARIWGRKPKA